MKAGEKPSSRSPSSKPAVSRNVCLWQGGGGGRGGGRGGGLEAAWSTHGMHSETSCISLPVLSFGGTWYSWASPPNDSGNKHLSSLPHLMNADRHTGRAPTLPFPPKDSCHCTDGGGGVAHGGVTRSLGGSSMFPIRPGSAGGHHCCCHLSPIVHPVRQCYDSTKLFREKMLPAFPLGGHTEGTHSH